MDALLLAIGPKCGLNFKPIHLVKREHYQLVVSSKVMDAMNGRDLI